MNFKIHSENKFSFITSKFNKNKYRISNKENHETWTLFLSFEEACCSYFGLLKECESSQASLELREINDKKHPFTDRIGNMYSKYTHVLEIKCNYFIAWAYCNQKERLPKKVMISDINEINRNKYFNYKGQIMRVSKIEEKVHDNLQPIDIKLKKFRNCKNKNIETFTICYDCETIIYEEQITPFMIVAKPSWDSDYFIWKYEDYEINESIHRGSKLFVNWLNKQISYLEMIKCADFNHSCNLKIRLYGFNNYNFDDHFIYRHLKKDLIGFKLEYYSRYVKTTSCTFRKNGTSFFINDIIKWFPATSLMKACKNYKIEQAKFEFDVHKYVIESSKEKRLIREVDNLSPYFKINIDDDFKNKYLQSNNKYDIYRLVEDYCIRDVLSTSLLYEKLTTNLTKVFDKLFEMGYSVPSYDIFDYVSTPQLAFNICTSILKKENQQIVIFENPEQCEAIYDAYYGGRCDYTYIGELVASPLDKEDAEFKYWDVTSEYPHAMKAYLPSVTKLESILTHEYINYDYYQKILDDTFHARQKAFENRTLHIDVSFFKMLNSFKGFFYVEVIPPPPHLCSTWAPVGTRIYEASSVKLKFFNAYQTKFLNTAHIQTYIHGGWKVNILKSHEKSRFNIVFTEQEKLLKPYIDLIGKEKCLARESGNEALAQIYKLLMNSLYGKMAQKPKHAIHHQKGNISDNYELGINEKSIHIDWQSSYHYIGSYITGWSNYILWKTCYHLELDKIYEGKSIAERAGTLCYVDTDSIIYNKHMVSDYVTFNLSEEIGFWEDDKSDFYITWKEEKFGAPIKKVLVLSKKFYVLLDQNNKILSIKSKGVHGPQAKLITYETLKRILSGDNHQITFEGIAKKHYEIEGECQYNKDFIKELTSARLKKTMRRENIHPSCEIIPFNEMIIKDNENNLNQTVNNNIKNYLKFTCSPFQIFNSENIVANSGSIVSDSDEDD